MKKLLISLTFLILLSFLPLFSWGQSYGTNSDGFPVYFMRNGRSHYTAPDYCVTACALTDSFHCAYFDNNNYLTVDDNDSLTFANAGVDEAFSISADIYMIDATEFRFIAKSQTSNIEYIFFINSSDKLAVLLYSGGGLTTYIGRLQTGTMTAYQNQWINVAFSYNGSEANTGLTLYVNGVSEASGAIGSGTYTGMGNTTSPLTIGTDRTTTAYGYVSNVRLMRGTLSAQNLTDIQTTTPTGNEVAWYPLTDYGSIYAHNVTSKQMIAKSTGDVNSILWSKKQKDFDYNSRFGFTSVLLKNQTYKIPHLFDSTTYLSDIDYVIMAGQSNSRGRGLLTDLSDSDSAKYWKVFTNSFIFDTATFKYNYLNPPTNNYNNATNGFGAELSLSYKYDSIGSDLFIYKYGFPETPLYDTPSYRDWNPISGEIFNTFVSHLESSLINSITTGYNPKLKSMIWMQGETDALSATESANYLTNITYFFDSLNHVSSSAVIPKTIGRISNSSVLTYRSNVRAAQSTYTGIAANKATLINTDSYGLSVDNVHYNAAGQITFGNDIFNDIINKTPTSALYLIDYNFKICNCE